MADTPVSPTPIGSWPTAPQRTDAPATFVTRADAWVSATPTRSTEMNALATNVNFNATSAFDSAAEAVVSASAASTSASNAAAQVVLAEAAADAADATANATLWTTGEAISEGDNRYSPTDFLTYRANKDISSGDNTVDPASDPTDWVSLTPPIDQKVVQVVNSTVQTQATGTAIIPFDNTIPQITEGTQVLSVSITPNNASNILTIQVDAFIGSSGSQVTMALFRDSEANALAATGSSFADSNQALPYSLTYKVAASSTSAQTYAVRIGAGGAATTRLNGWNSGQIYGGRGSSSITIIESTP